MSRKGVITKRVKTVQTALSRKQRPTAQSGWPRNYCFALGQNHIRPSEVSAKVRSQPADHKSRPGNIAPTITSRRYAHDHAARAGEQGLAAAQPVRVPRPMDPSEPGKIVPRPAENLRPNPYPPDHAGRPCNHPATTVPTRPKIQLTGRSSHDRPNAAVDPKPFLKPKSMFSSPA
ncbi:unnamed protein product [Microthlaspi erraticum]|uniref:Uncharacterized protein n=1 Tax=Microthlaspi erraticum TaxID=1685480 RepID=A0A6D2JNP4_9BRAS|nr:unnamed protein product [Microthlaspi erraticum]